MDRPNTKERLLRTALDLIWAESYGFVSVGDICKKAGLHKGSFYHFFKSKSELAASALSIFWKALEPKLDYIIYSHEPLKKKISQLCDTIYTLHKKKSEQFGFVCGCPYIIVGSERAHIDKELGAVVKPIFDQRAKYFFQLARDAAHEKYIKPGEVESKATLLFASYLGLLIQARINNDLTILKNMKNFYYGALNIKNKK